MTLITPETISAAKQRSIVALIGREVTLRKSGKEWVGLCPFHKERTASFYVNEHKGLYTCFGCGAGGDSLDYAQNAYGLSFPEAVEHLAGDIALPRVTIFQQDEPENNAERVARVQRIWKASQPIAGTIAETYLRGRGITVPLPETLRFHPALEHRTGVRLPAMVAAIVTAPSRVVTAVHQTFIKHDGSGKIPSGTPRLTLGPATGGAIRLAPWAGGRLAIAEGVETALSAMQLFGIPAWSARNNTSMPNLVLPEGARDILICADHDSNGVGQAIAQLAAERWRGEGRSVEIALPELADTDFNDVLVAQVGRLGLDRPAIRLQGYSS